MPKKLPELSPSQREIMEIVWSRGEVSARQVREELAGQRDLARNTVRTLLERMEAKGWLTHRIDGRTHLYSALRPREATVRDKVRELIDSVCGGSPVTLLTAMLDDRALSDQEIDRIRRMLSEAKSKKKPKNDRSS